MLEKQMINEVTARLHEIGLKQGQATAGGNTRRVNFEYQAFTFALRRTLEYFAASVGAFFKREVIRIRDLANAIRNDEPEEIRNRVLTRLHECVQGLEDVLPAQGRPKSIRDVLAHWKHVPAGHLNIVRWPDGIRVGLAGGGENLRFEEFVETTLQSAGDFNVKVALLAPHLRNQLERVESLIFGIYSDMGLLQSA